MFTAYSKGSRGLSVGLDVVLPGFLDAVLGGFPSRFKGSMESPVSFLAKFL